MSTHKHIDRICVIVVLITVLITILFMNGEALGMTVIASEESGDELFTANDLNDDWDTDGATVITLSDSGSTVKGNGAYEYMGDVYIVYAGKYIIAGELTDGSIVIEAEGDDKIWLLFDGVSIHCADNAALRIEEAGKVFLTLAEGSENTLSCGSVYSADAVTANVDGAVYSRDDLTINGEGSLTVTAEYQHGIVCNDDLALTGGNISVTAAEDGIHANDSVRVRDAQLAISAVDDAVTVSNDDDTSFIHIASGTVRVLSCYEGLEATKVTVAGGAVDITSLDDGINACGYGEGSAIYITGGEITVTNAGGNDADGIDSNRDIFISGGKLLISVPNDGSSSAIDYGSESGGVCRITGGTVLACGSSAMAEGFDSDSTQGFFMYTTNAQSGSAVKVCDTEGNVLIDEVVPCAFSSMLVSTPQMKVGDTVTVTVGDSSAEVSVDNSAGTAGFGGRPDGMFGGGQNGNRPQGIIGGEDGAPQGSAGAGRPGFGDMQQSGDRGAPWDSEGQTDAAAPDAGRPGFGDMQQSGDRGAPWNNEGQTGAAAQDAGGSGISGESLLLLIISTVVLIAGVIVAFFFRQRG